MYELPRDFKGAVAGGGERFPDLGDSEIVFENGLPLSGGNLQIVRLELVRIFKKENILQKRNGGPGAEPPATIFSLFGPMSR